jgi:hypothetical protein
MSIILPLLFAVAVQQTTCPMHAQHNADGSVEHGAGVDHRHDTLGVSHQSSTHSFRLFADGGAIELHAASEKETVAIDGIRTHLQTIVKQFNAADFSTPMFVHDKSPDGIDDMKRLRDRIAYRYEPLADGARIHIITGDPQALAAVHAFLRFQVIEHRTANSGEVERDQ